VTGGIWFADAPARTDEPYAVVSFVDTSQMDTFDADGFELVFQVTIYGTKASGPRAVMDTADALRGRVHRVSWATSGFAMMQGSIDQERGPSREGEQWRYDVDVRVMGFAT
jgi:hypothetical protein